MPRKSTDSKKSHDTAKTINTPSPYGSHKAMVVDTPEKLVIDENQCVCKDDDGLYITLKTRLDSGLADPNRYGNSNARIHT